MSGPRGFGLWPSKRTLPSRAVKTHAGPKNDSRRRRLLLTEALTPWAALNTRRENTVPHPSAACHRPSVLPVAPRCASLPLRARPRLSPRLGSWRLLHKRLYAAMRSRGKPAPTVVRRSKPEPRIAEEFSVRYRSLIDFVDFNNSDTWNRRLIPQRVGTAQLKRLNRDRVISGREVDQGAGFATVGGGQARGRDLLFTV